jgi:hypothetical protein
MLGSSSNFCIHLFSFVCHRELQLSRQLDCGVENEKDARVNHHDRKGAMQACSACLTIPRRQYHAPDNGNPAVRQLYFSSSYSPDKIRIFTCDVQTSFCVLIAPILTDLTHRPQISLSATRSTAEHSKMSVTKSSPAEAVPGVVIANAASKASSQLTQLTQKLGKRVNGTKFTVHQSPDGFNH